MPNPIAKIIKNKPKRRKHSRKTEVELNSKGKAVSRTTKETLGSEILKTNRANTAQRHKTKRATAKYKAASRTALYGGVSAASTADDLSKTSANLEPTYPERDRRRPRPQPDKEEKKQPDNKGGEDPSGQVNTMQMGEQGSNPALAENPKESHLKYDVRDGTYHD